MIRLRVNPDVLTAALEHGAVLLNLQTATYYGVDQAGLSVWRDLQSIRAEDVALRPSWAKFLADLEREQLLVPCVNQPSEEIQRPGTTRHDGGEPRLSKHGEPLHGAAATLSDSDALPRWADLRIPPPFVTVIVPVRDGERTLGDCLASLLASDYPVGHREIVVVDNNSKDRTAEIIRAFPVRSAWEQQRGASAARNRGIAVSQGEILAFTDADCVVTSSWLRELVRGFEKGDTAAVAGEIMAFPPSTKPERYMAKRVPRWQCANLSAPQPSIVTASIAFRRTVFEQIGLFDPRLTRAQDTDFGWRFLRSCGLQFRYSPRAIVLHRHRATTAQFILHQAKWGYGGALLGSKYELPSRVQEELRSYRALLVQLLCLARTGARSTWRRRDWDDLEYAYFEFLRQLGRRMGALAWLVAGSRFKR